MEHFVFEQWSVTEYLYEKCQFYIFSYTYVVWTHYYQQNECSRTSHVVLLLSLIIDNRSNSDEVLRFSLDYSVRCAVS